MIRAALRYLAEAFAPRPAAPVDLSPEAIAVSLISELVPAISAAVFAGIPLSEIRAKLVAAHSAEWQRRHGLAIAYAAERLLCQLGPAAFLSDDHARRAGLNPPAPSRRNRR